MAVNGLEDYTRSLFQLLVNHNVSMEKSSASRNIALLADTVGEANIKQIFEEAKGYSDAKEVANFLNQKLHDSVLSLIPEKLKISFNRTFNTAINAQTPIFAGGVPGNLRPDWFTEQIQRELVESCADS